MVIGGEVSSLNEFTFWFYVWVLSVFLVCLLDLKFGNLNLLRLFFLSSLKVKEVNLGP